MTTSLDPMQMITAGAEPWMNAAAWAVAFIIVAIGATLALRLWHTARFRPIALMLLAVELGFAAWAVSSVYTDYF